MTGFKYTYQNRRTSNGLTGVELSPCDGDARKSVFRFQGPAAEAMEPFDIEQAVEKWTNWGNADDTNYNLWSAIQNVTWGLESEGQADLALTCLLRMLPCSPNFQAFDAINRGIGGLLKQVERYGDAVACFKECLVKLPKETQFQYALHNNMGYCLCMLNLSAEAEQCCREAVRLNPDEYHAQKNLGAALLGQLRFVEAAACFMRMIELARGDSNAVDVVQGFLAKIPQLAAEAPETVAKIRDLLGKTTADVPSVPTVKAAGEK